MKRLALALFAALMLSATPAAAASGGGSAGLSCSFATTSAGTSVNVAGMSTSTHLFYEVQLSNGATETGPWPPRATYSFPFGVLAPGSYSAEVIVMRGEGGHAAGGPGAWIFIGFTFVPNLCSVAL